MNPKYHLLVAVAALSLGACSTDDTHTGPENGGYKISFTVAEDSETRTTLTAGDFMRWVPTDKVGIYTVGKNENPNTLTVADINQHPVEFIGVLEKLVSKGDMFYAYYPYDKEQSAEPTAVKLAIPAEQTQTEAGVYNGQSHPLVAMPMEIEWEKDSYAGRINSARFRLLGAIVELQLFSSNEALRGEKIRSVAFESETPLAGDFTFDLTGVAVDKEPQISGYALTEVTTSLEESAAIPATKDEAALVYLTIAPGTYTGRIVVETDVAQYTFGLTKAMTFERAVIKGLPADLAGAEREALVSEDPIHFEDQSVKDICVTNWDTNGDGELSYKEAAAVKSIGSLFKGTSISSFNELQYFTGLQSIENSAFYGCSSLTSIHIPDGVTKIGNSAFRDCSSLTSTNIPEGVTAIEHSTFYNCSSLTNIDIPEGVTAIKVYAFYNCSSLTGIDIPEGVTAIGEAVFSGCSSLTSIHIPDRVTTIGVNAFWSCSSLTSINIPQTVTSIGKDAFQGCSSLSAFEGKYASADNRCLIKDGELFAFAPAGLTDYPIPDGVTSIGNNVFYGCNNLTSIHIPDQVTSIGNSAFYNCHSLTSINIPDGVTKIGDNTFYYCTKLKSITIPDKVTSIGNSAFRYCSSLTKLYCKPTTPPTLGVNPFFSTSSSMQIYVPTASLKAYKTAEGWSKYADRIVEDNN